MIHASVEVGIATLPNGETIDLLAIQALLNEHYQEFGDGAYAHASNELSKLTGLVQGPHGDWEEAA